MSWSRRSAASGTAPRRTTRSGGRSRPSSAFCARRSEAVLEVAAASGLTLLVPRSGTRRRASSAGTGELIAAAIEAGVAGPRRGRRQRHHGWRRRGDQGARGCRRSARREARGPLRHDRAVRARGRGLRPAEGRQPGSGRAAHLAPGRAGGGATTRPARAGDDRRRGGLPGGLWAAFGAHLIPGAATVLGMLGFDRRLEDADAVITGEGRRRQSLRGSSRARSPGAAAPPASPCT